jgi:hypothetical protein
VMGDWAKGELLARGLAVDDGFGCATCRARSAGTCTTSIP